MQGLGLVDHSPNNPQPGTQLSTASNLVIIDNYDSFTWNVYQYLVLEGATVTVYRNDEITVAELIDIKPTQLVVSPGPGHPDTDAGISCEVIRHFAGKIPIFGVCMGEQCIFSVFGGKVEVTGEILHGKTSPLRHDSQGIYEGLAQDIPVTRYHSLAGTHLSLPDSLEVTSWIPSIPDGSKGIIMGVRHKQFVVEGVQFHPESILTEEGRIMLKNFLKMEDGTWDENNARRTSSRKGELANGVKRMNDNLTSSNSETKAHDTKKSILEDIFEHRKRCVKAQKLVLSQRPTDLQASYNLSISPPQIPFVDRLRQSPYNLSLMAEIKRASPSKGVISLETCAPQQARRYALAGASVISVLTEPEWFKGSIDDLRAVRQSLEGMPSRPAVLRKEFIFDEYQILEARLAGADTVLLIVKMLDEDTLRKLYQYSQSLGMEPLVEVNTLDEMDTAISIGARVVGVNNRNLTNFEVDLDTTSRLMHKVPKETIVCALSGISGPKDVFGYSKSGVGAVLVGEALMRATDPAAFVQDLLGRSKPNGVSRAEDGLLVKICGTRSPEAAKVAIEAGADFIGIILVEGRTRCVSRDIAQAISRVCKTTRKPHTRKAGGRNSEATVASDYFEHTSAQLRQQDRALLVGVFRNQPLSYVLEQQRMLNLDVVQLHGSEPIEWASLIPVPVIRRFGFQETGLGRRGYHALPLLDSALGGTGQTLDVMSVRKTMKADPGLRVILAGGLTPMNVKEILDKVSDLRYMITAVDVSSGVEEGVQHKMPRKQRLAFQGLTIAAEGNFGKARRHNLLKHMVELRGGRWSYFNTTQITHLICSKKAYLKKTPKVLWALRQGKIEIVTFDWLEHSFVAERLMPLAGKYVITEDDINCDKENKMRKALVERNAIEESLKNFDSECQEISRDLTTERYEIYRDSTTFAYKVILVRLNVEQNTSERCYLKLCVTNDWPQYFACYYIDYAPGRLPHKTILANKHSDKGMAFQSFEEVFEEKTKVQWDDRLGWTSTHRDAFVYVRPKEGEPKGLCWRIGCMMGSYHGCHVCNSA
ncbi:MAG: hypothetical protein Q9166_007538 [cf. Caloplaca sp. 2 TL-2023]